MLNLFDFLIIGLFIVIIVSLYGILKPENIKNGTIISKQHSRKKTLKDIVDLKHIKDKKALSEAVEKIIKDNIEIGKNKLLKIDKTFEPQSFMEKSKNTFETILKSFENKDRKTLKTLVSEKVYNIFDKSMKEFEKNKQTLDTEIVRFKNISIRDINVEGKFASIIIEFISEQTTVLKDADGKIIKGDDNYLETIEDTWIFGRDYGIKDSRWLLCETVEL